MMWAILDPRLFEEHDRLQDVLRQLVTVLRRSKAKIPEIYPYWPRLETERFAPLRRYNRDLDEIRLYRSREGLGGSVPAASISGLDHLLKGTDPDWVSIFADLVLACALAEETILVTRLIEGRNLRRHLDQDNREALREKILWDIRIELGASPIRIPLICVERNLVVPWTTRFDEALPAIEDGALFPFCPPTGWQDEMVVHGTNKARLCWFDKDRKRSWAQPRTPGAPRHWDVQLNSADLRDEYGLDYLNIVRFGEPPDEGRPGSLHHLPENLRSQLRKETGWKC